MAERDRRREPWIAEVGEVRHELMPGSAKLVDGAVPREADDRRRRRPLDLHAGLVQRARPEGGAARSQQRELEEPRRFDAPPWSERGLIGGVVPDEKRLDAAARQDRDDRLRLRRILVEEMTDREALELGRVAVHASALEEVRPERARDIGQNTRAVAFAIDRSRAVRQARHTVENKVQHLMRRPRVLPRHRYQRTGVVLARHISSRNNKASLSGRLSSLCVTAVATRPRPPTLLPTTPLGDPSPCR